LANDPETSQPFSQSYPDVVIGIAEILFEKKRFKDALPFYNAVKQVPGQNSAELCIQIGKCLVREDDSKGAEQVLREACLLDQSNIEARVELARMYENMDEADQAHVYVNQILQLQKANRPKVTRQRLDPISNQLQPILAPAPPPSQQRSIVPMTKDASAKLRKAKKADEKVLDREVQAMQLREYYLILKESMDRMRSGSQSATDSWMDAARGLTEDFRSCVAFYPWDRREFGGYSAEEQKTAQMNLNMDVKALAEQREQSKLKPSN
jgi:general transcription factor 3C polypeptide 3 (transcription factor C subunit 4)